MTERCEELLNICCEYGAVSIFGICNNKKLLCCHWTRLTDYGLTSRAVFQLYSGKEHAQTIH